jgi:ubiquinone/menaquinone biosynthesis C-methylase UbiE
MKELNIITSLHTKTKRNYIERMISKKVECMTISKKYGYDYWDGNRKFGYGGYKYIPGRWEQVAKKFIKKYKLDNHSKILDLGCGKGFLLFEIKKILPKISITGIDFSNYGLKNSKREISQFLFKADLRKKLKFKTKEFDFVFSINTLHNLEINYLIQAIKEIQRVGKKHFICSESYRNEKELFNLQCWALTCESFFSKKEWVWLLKSNKYTGDYEFIYFE